MYSAIILSVVLILIVTRIKIPMTRLEIYANCVFAVFLNIIVDTFLDLKYDLYGYFDKGVDGENVIAIFGIYPAVNLLFLTYFPYGKPIWKKFLYVFLWTVCSLIKESILLHTELLYYNNWSIWYSAISYPLLFLILAGNHSFIRYLNQKKTPT